MTMRLRCILGVVLLPSIACKGGPDPDEPVRYVLRSKDLGLLGATITVEGVKATFEREHYNLLMSIDKDAWLAETLSHEELFLKLRDKLPPDLLWERELQVSRLWRTPERWEPSPCW